MSGPRTLDGLERVRVSTTRPDNPGALTAVEADEFVTIECHILKSDFRLSPTASDTISDSLLCTVGNAVSYGASNYEGTVSPVRFLDEDGLPDPENDIAWDLFKQKGTRLWILVSEGPAHTEAFASGQEYDLYEVVTDSPQKPSDRAGWIKRTVPLGVQNAWLNRTIASAG